MAAALLASGCAGSQPDPGVRAHARDDTVTTATPPRVDDAARSRDADCPMPAPLRRSAATRFDAAEARSLVDAAAADATRRGHRFLMRARLTVGDAGPSATLTLRGRRTATNRSTATLRWTGALGVLLPNADLRIAGDQLSIRIAGRQEFEPRGSASGISLDVGRELLMHPFLVTTRDAWRTRSGHLHVQLDVPAADLRAYATAERQGPVTELLRDARTLRMTVVLDSDGRLAGDGFTLVTRVPAGVVARALDDRVVTLRARTGYC